MSFSNNKERGSNKQQHKRIIILSEDYNFKPAKLKLVTSLNSLSTHPTSFLLQPLVELYSGKKGDESCSQRKQKLHCISFRKVFGNKILANRIAIVEYSRNPSKTDVLSYNQILKI